MMIPTVLIGLAATSLGKGSPPEESFSYWVYLNADNLNVSIENIN